MPPSKIKTILKTGAKYTQGRDTQDNNILAARVMGDLLRTSLGPKGSDKMFKDGIDIILTNDGRTILDKLKLQHPVAKMIAEASKWVDLLVGDGTTSVGILASSLLWNARSLLQDGIHPSVIVDGYLAALERSLEILGQIAEDIDVDDRKQLMGVALTSLRTKMADQTSLDHVAELVVDGVLTVTEKRAWGTMVEKDSLHVVRKYGKTISDSELLDGLSIWREPSSGSMPNRVENARIALVSSPFEIRKLTVGKPEVSIGRPEQMRQFVDAEHKIFDEMLEKVKQSGANVVVCQHGLDDYIQLTMGRMGILGVRRAQESDLKNLEKATGGRLVPLEELSSGTLGECALIEMRKLELESYMFFEGCKNPRSSTLLLRGATREVVDELQRAVDDAIMATIDVVERPKILAGGGSPEAELAHRLRVWGRTVRGRKQLAVMKFAQALEAIPEALAETAGMSVLDSAIALRWKHGDGGLWFGVDVNEMDVADMRERGVVEPLKVKLQVIKIAVETAVMVMRLDASFVEPKKGKRRMTTSMTPGYGNKLDRIGRKFPRPHH